MSLKDDGTIKVDLGSIELTADEFAALGLQRRNGAIREWAHGAIKTALADKTKNYVETTKQERIKALREKQERVAAELAALNAPAP